MREEKLSFINNYIIQELYISIIKITNKPETLIIKRMMLSGTNSPPAEVSTQL